MRALAFVLAVGSVVAAQDPQVDQKRVDKAIGKGVEYLLSSAPATPSHAGTAENLILWTVIHAGVEEKDPRFRKHLERMLDEPLRKTYQACLRAMILEELDRVKYQPFIHQCAQFILDNQCRNGQWSYGEPTELAEVPPLREVVTGVRRRGRREEPRVDEAGFRIKPRVKRKMFVRKRKEGPESGDNSNTQYAALALRACFDAGIMLPKDNIVLASNWWRVSQLPDEGKAEGRLATGRRTGAIRGWCYSEGGERTHNAYASMTAGAVGSLVIYDYILKKDWKKDKSVQAGVNWLGHHFTVTENAGPPEHKQGDVKFQHYYYLYALERAGMLYDTETFGGRRWYAEGANLLLDAQKENGSWNESAWYRGEQPTWDTCFAILFLKKATRRIDVASIDRFRKK